jgi:hypothetical protein
MVISFGVGWVVGMKKRHGRSKKKQVLKLKSEKELEGYAPALALSIHDQGLGFRDGPNNFKKVNHDAKKTDN